MRQQYKFGFSCVGWLANASLMVLATAAHAADAKQIQRGDEVKISSTLVAGNTTGGYDWVAEQDQNWKRGIITAIEVCSGDAVNSITPYYDGQRGTEFGGPGGNCETWQVPPGEFIQTVEVWSGDWMNKIIFKTNKLKESPAFGGAGGNRKVWQDPNGGALRRIDGKSGNYMNGVKLYFGYPYRLGNLVYDFSEKSTASLPPKRIVTAGINACNFPNEQSKIVTVTDKETESHTLSFGFSAGMGFETKFTAGVPDISSASVTTTLNFEIRSDQSSTMETAYEYQDAIPILAKPGQKVDVVTITKMDKLTIPFTYDLIFYKNNDPNQITETRQFKGEYKGVQVVNSTTEPTIIPCPGSTSTAAVAPPPPPPPTPTPGGPFSGTWSCPPYGSIKIDQAGDGITGTYSWGGGGTFQGGVTDRFMRATVNDGKGNPIPYVWEMTLSADGSRLDGKVIENQTASSQWGCSLSSAP